jgi:nitrate reductase gamma subunit
VLLVQVGLGVYIAVNLRWGSSWFAVALTPYLRSLVTLQPDVTLLSPLPLAVKLHVFGMFLFLVLLSYSRLVHLLVVPWQYIGRPPLVVMWNRRRGRAGSPVSLSVKQEASSDREEALR